MDFPKKFYVARVRRGTGLDEVLGYMVEADKEHTKAFEKKKSSADRWASGSNRLDPIYVDNEPKTGFVMVTNVSRYSTSNVVWRCRHPEGFEFEITSSNMCDLIANNTIINGEFQDAMFFNHSRELINAKTTTYAKMVEKKEAQEERKNFADSIQPGDGFSTEYSKDEYVYLGEFHAICENKNKELNYAAKSTKMHLIKNISTGQYLLRSKMSDHNLQMSAKSNCKFDRKTVMEEANAQARDGNFKVQGSHFEPLDDHRIPILIAEKPFKFSDLKVKYQSVPMSSIGNLVNSVIYLSEKNGTQYRILTGLSENNNRGYSYYNDDYTIRTKVAGMHKLCGYPCELDENGHVIMDVDMSLHKTFNNWHYSSPFYPPHKRYQHNSGYKGVQTTRLEMPENITVGYYTLGE